MYKIQLCKDRLKSNAFMHITLTGWQILQMNTESVRMKKIIQTKLALICTALHEYEVLILTTLLHHNLLYISKHLH